MNERDRFLAPSSTRDLMVARLVSEHDAAVFCEHDHETALLARKLRQKKGD